jgi:hypothetical protein
MANTPELEACSVCGRLSKKHWLRCCLGRMRGSRPPLSAAIRPSLSGAV